MKQTFGDKRVKTKVRITHIFVCGKQTVSMLLTFSLNSLINIKLGLIILYPRDEEIEA